jgi:hypothetical protein
MKLRFVAYAFIITFGGLTATAQGQPTPTLAQAAPPTRSQPAPAPMALPTAHQVQQQDVLDAAIREAATYFNINITEGSKIAILSVRSDYPQLSEYVIDIFTGNVVNDRRFKVVERSALEAIRKEMEFQMSGEVDDNSAQAIGRKIGAQTILLGSMSGYGSTWRLSMRALVVESAEVVGLFNKNIPNTGIIAELSSGPKQPAAQAQSYGTSSGQATPQATAAAPVGIEVPYGRYIIKNEAGLALDVAWESNNNGAEIIVYSEHGNSNQQFFIESLPDKTYKITAVHSHKPLTVKGEQVVQWEWENSDSQKWTISGKSMSNVMFINKQSGKVLSVWGNPRSSNTKIHVRSGDGTIEQRFSLIKR